MRAEPERFIYRVIKLEYHTDKEIVALLRREGYKSTNHAMPAYEIEVQYNDRDAVPAIGKAVWLELEVP